MDGINRLDKRMIFIGADSVISPLGIGTEVNFSRVLEGESALQSSTNLLGIDTEWPVGIIKDYDHLEGYTKLESLAVQTCQASLSKLKDLSGKWLLILSTTKGDIDQLSSGLSKQVRPQYLARRVAKKLPIEAKVKVVSNACTSGLLAVVLAHDYISTDCYDHVLVLGADAFSQFTLTGFESFMALSDKRCKPFDLDRNGLSLGEAVASAVVSKNDNIFEKKPKVILGGASANDANHISGPSREGEGLFRAIQKTLEKAHIKQSDIDAISAHGTATKYNDDMESIAFDRMGLSHLPINSLKGYFGHTLGTAGLLELIISIRSMDHGVVLKSLGFETPGTVREINVTSENLNVEFGTLLKTASGFGGCNAAAIIKK